MLKNRYMCMGCGLFWSTEEKMVNAVHHCPYCGDMYFVDNVDLNIPPPLYEYESLTPSCGHVFHSDTPGDVTACCFCGKGLDVKSGDTLAKWQEGELGRLGL